MHVSIFFSHAFSSTIYDCYKNIDSSTMTAIRTLIVAL